MTTLRSVRPAHGLPRLALTSGLLLCALATIRCDLTLPLTPDELVSADPDTPTLKEWLKRLEFSSWVERMRTPEPMRVAILQLQQAMGAEVRQYYQIEADGSFSTDVLVLWAER